MRNGSRMAVVIQESIRSLVPMALSLTTQHFMYMLIKVRRDHGLSGYKQVKIIQTWQMIKVFWIDNITDYLQLMRHCPFSNE